MSDLDLENELLGSDDDLASEPDIGEADELAKSPIPEPTRKSKSPSEHDVNGNARITSSSRGPSREADASRTRYAFG